MQVRHYRELTVWQKAMDLAELCYNATQTFPRTEAFAMVPQIRKCGASVAANIAEGQARGQSKEFLQFLRIARGSLAELETHFLLCHRVGLVDQDQLNSVMNLAAEVGKMLRGLYNAIANGNKESIER